MWRQAWVCMCAQTRAHARRAYILLATVFSSLHRDSKERFAAYMKDTAFGWSLAEQLTMTYQVRRLCYVTRMMCS